MTLRSFPGTMQRRVVSITVGAAAAARSGIMRYVLYGLVGLMLATIAGGVFIFVAAPTGYVRDRLIAEVRLQTGRLLVVAGDASFTVYPRLGVVLENVSLSGPPGLENETFVRMERLRLAIPLLPLMRRELAIDEFVLVKPVIQLAVDEKGRRTWDFTPPAATSAAKEVTPATDASAVGWSSDGVTDPSIVTVTTDPAVPVQEKRKLTDVLANLSLGDVRIEHGEVRYANLLTKSRQRFTEVDVKLALSAIDAPFEASGSLVWRKQRLPFTARLETLRSFLDTSPARLALAIDADHLVAAYDGKLDIAGIALLDGELTVRTTSVRGLGAWIGAKLPPVGGLGPLDLQAHLTVAGPSYQLTKAKLALDGAYATGNLTLDTQGSRPLLKGQVNVDKLDLNLYLADRTLSARNGTPPESEEIQAREAATSDAAEALVDVDETASMAEVELAKSKPTGRGWSNAPINLAGLKILDADVTIAAGALDYRDIKIGKNRVVLTLKDGLLKARLPELAAYGGKGLGTIQIDAQSAMPRVSGNITVNGVSVLPLLTDALAFDWIAGSGSISLGFTAQGRSQKALVQTLTGQGRFAFTDGAIVGLNIPKTVRGLGRGKLSGFERDNTLTTDFSELSGTLSIVKGIVTNKDLNLVGPLIRMAGAGTIDMPARRLDYAAMPKIVASLEGQGGVDETGVTIPVRIRGPWSKPKIVPDLEGLAKNPEAVAETAKQLADKLKDSDKKKIKKALEKLTGGKSDPEVENLIGGVLGQ
jgi:AsmA protein